MKDYCNQPGCPEEAVYRGLCAKHGRQADRATHDAGRKAFYNSAAWRAFRLRRLALNRFCELCMFEVASDVDHIIPLENGGPALSIENTQCLCKPCHSRKTWSETLKGDRVGKTSEG